MKNNRGFTLIEMIVVLVLMSLLACYAIPNIQSTYQRYLVRNTAMQLHQDLLWIQSIQQNTGHRTKLQFQQTSSGVRYHLQEYSYRNGRWVMANIRTVYIPTSVTISGQSITFEEGKTYANQHLTIAGTDSEYYLYCYNTGRLRLAKKEE